MYKEYLENEEIKNTVKLLMALAFLPKNMVRMNFNIIVGSHYSFTKLKVTTSLLIL